VTTNERTIGYGVGLADDADLRLCGDLEGKRVVELGLAPDGSNAIAIALSGAKTIVLEPSATHIAELRKAAEAAETHVECHEGDLADLGFLTSASVDLVVSVGRLHEVDDLPRVLRQVHRVLRTEAPFVLALPHPAAVGDDEPYGAGTFTVAGLFMSLLRADFRVDVVYELAPVDRRALRPSTLVVRARKLGV
jgi:SAM-dependent methyltransferase